MITPAAANVIKAIRELTEEERRGLFERIEDSYCIACGREAPKGEKARERFEEDHGCPFEDDSDADLDDEDDGDEDDEDEEGTDG